MINVAHLRLQRGGIRSCYTNCYTPYALTHPNPPLPCWKILLFTLICLLDHLYIGRQFSLLKELKVFLWLAFTHFFCVWRYFKNLSLYYQCCHFYHYFMRCHHTADLSTLEIFSRLINFQCTYIFEMPKIGWFYGYYLLWGQILSKILSTVIQPMQK